MQTDRR